MIASDPRERTDGDTTTWQFDEASGLQLSKTYADGLWEIKAYDALGRIATETDGRGVTKTRTYDTSRGLLIRTEYSDGTTPREFAYDHLGQLTRVTDDAGIRTITYNTYGEQESDALVVGNDTHAVTEQRDAQGRSTGYTYAKNGATIETVTQGYGTQGRINTLTFTHSGARKQFTYGYLAGSNLLESLTMPNDMTLTQSYEHNRDLLTDMVYKRGGDLVTQRSYTYDELGRPTARGTDYPLKDIAHHDSFSYNTRSELTQAQLDDDSYKYAYDNIGNRESAQEAAEELTTYTANDLNQYTAIQEGSEAPFEPKFDAAGNQTLVKTKTGIWSVVYNAENRPVIFTCIDNNIIIECWYDFMGRRAFKKVTTNRRVTLHQRYTYRGYLQIAAHDLLKVNHPALWRLIWDPTQPVATRPLAIRKDNVWYAYGWDLTKNICEVYGQTGYIRTLYRYSPFGSVTAEGEVIQSIQWSSEYHDSELSLCYYNYRYYNSADIRWLSRDSIEESGYNLYSYISNKAPEHFDILGREASKEHCCTVTLYVDPPSPDAVENNVLNVIIDTGHTWVEFEDCDKTIIFSVGPENTIAGKKGAKKFRLGKTPGTTDFQTYFHRANAVTKEWKMGKNQCKKAKKVFEEQAQQKVQYSPEYQCTSAALQLLNAIPVTPSPPDGIGPVVAKIIEDDPKSGKILWSGHIPNPYHLSKALEGA